jgi:DNA-binding transcriptional LysR family regulator
VDAGRDINLTLRQIEIVQAIMISGSIAGAARFLNVAQPGISRALKHLESNLGITLFTRHGGRLVPAAEAKDIFEQLQEVHEKLRHFNFSLNQLRRGKGVELSIGSVPSIAQAMVPQAAARFRERFPDVRINIELLKIEEAVDYLMLRRGEVCCMSYRLDNASIEFLPLVKGHLACLVPRGHPLADAGPIGVHDIVKYPLIGIDPKDPYGEIMANLFAAHNLDYDTPIRARFGSTVIALVQQKLGIAVLDSFTLHTIRNSSSDLVVLPIAEETSFQTYVARRRDIELSGFAQHFLSDLKAIMTQAAGA